METIDGLACVRRMETVGNYISNSNIKEMVLESNPGMSYYCRINSPLSTIKNNLYLIIKPFENCNQDKILHITERIKECMNAEFAVYPGQLKVFNIMHSCLKVQVENKEHIIDLIKAYENEGVKFVKSKKVEAYTTLVSTKECLSMVEAEKLVYKDIARDEVHYLEIPYNLEWEDFKDIEVQIKNTFGYKDFETALISVYKGNKFREFIRIYVKGGCTCESFLVLRDKFSSKMMM